MNESFYLILISYCILLLCLSIRIFYCSILKFKPNPQNTSNICVLKMSRHYDFGLWEYVLLRYAIMINELIKLLILDYF